MKLKSCIFENSLEHNHMRRGHEFTQGGVEERMGRSEPTGVGGGGVLDRISLTEDQRKIFQSH